ncbi:MAG: serine/threonine protein kinase [Planctomycetes bacterium]|nr:serine/threonine protein kinase [Planctomycetota bacterium]
MDGGGKLAARLVMEGLLDEATARAVLAKQAELQQRGHVLGVADICLRKHWITAGEAALLQGEHPPEKLLPGLLLGPQLARGGMGRVIRARDIEARCDVAVKILHPRLARDPRSAAEFRAEGELLCRLEHPNLVKGWYLHEHEGLIYFVMECFPGCSAQEELDRRGRFTEEKALAVIVQVARALTHMHEHGFLHRDVKPANILLDPQGRVKLCDLGLAVKLDHAAGETTAGTRAYIAPEQATGSGLDPRADIYALGASLYHLVVGRLPFEGPTDDEGMARRLLDELRSPELKALGISQRMHYFIQKMMALEREVRYASPQALVEDIMAQTGIGSAPPPTPKSDPRLRRLR